MEGPTPVSALIHAATLVTAGVFFLIRCSYLFEYSEISLFILITLGGLTSILGASIAVFQNDIKKIIAFSTTSQLGYMVFSCGISSYSIALFHLFNHGFFKALLFLSAGAVIHSLGNEQDLRKYGALSKFLPFTYTCMFFGFFSLAGMPFFSGYYSKELLLESGYASYHIISYFSFFLCTIVALLTSFYSFRCFYLVFLGNNNLAKPSLTFLFELPKYMAFCLFFLTLGALFAGYLFSDLFTHSFNFI